MCCAHHVGIKFVKDLLNCKTLCSGLLKGERNKGYVIVKREKYVDSKGREVKPPTIHKKKHNKESKKKEGPKPKDKTKSKPQTQLKH
jgi:hypothetical protein